MPRPVLARRTEPCTGAAVARSSAMGRRAASREYSRAVPGVARSRSATFQLSMDAGPRLRDLELLGHRRLQRGGGRGLVGVALVQHGDAPADALEGPH